jgi:hypothetical protein
VDISSPVGCFSWDWSSAYSNQNLHVKKKGSDRTRALLGWLDEDPHLDDSEKLVNRATMLVSAWGWEFFWGILSWLYSQRMIFLETSQSILEPLNGQSPSMTNFMTISASCTRLC